MFSIEAQLLETHNGFLKTALELVFHYDII